MRSPLRIFSALSTRSNSRSPPAPGIGVIEPGSPRRGASARDAEVLVGEQHHDRVAVRDRLDLADEALAVDDRVVDVDAVAGALVDRHGLVPGARGALVDARLDRVVLLQAAGGVHLLQALELLELAVLDLELRDLAAQRVALALEPVALVLGVERVAEPPEQVADRLERLVRPLLDRSEDLQRAALDGVQATAGGFAEVRGQQEQRQRDQQGEDGTAPPDDLVVHTERNSERVEGFKGPLSAEIAGCGCFGWSGGSPRTPRASDPSRPRRTSAGTRRGAPASASRRAGARRAPAAASRRRPA